MKSFISQQDTYMRREAIQRLSTFSTCLLLLISMGFSILLFNNPYFVEVGFGLAFLTLVYLLGKRVYKSSFISATASSLFLIDPLFIDLSSQASYELGQATFLLLYVYFMIFDENNFILQGISLGLLATTKFWGAAVFFVLLFNSYKIIIKKFKLGIFVRRLTVAFIVFCLVYLVSFINQKGLFNIVFFSVKGNKVLATTLYYKHSVRFGVSIHHRFL